MAMVHPAEGRRRHVLTEAIAVAVTPSTSLERMGGQGIHVPDPNLHILELSSIKPGGDPE